MKMVLNILFHLFVIAWYGYLSVSRMEDLISGNLAGMSLFFFLLRAAIAIVFSINLWKMTSRKKRYENDSSVLRPTK